MPSRAAPACTDLQPQLQQAWGFPSARAGETASHNNGPRAGGFTTAQVESPGRGLMPPIKVTMRQQECASSNMTGMAERARVHAILHLVQSPTRVIFLFAAAADR